MKSQRGVTLSSLAIYIVLVLVVLGILSVITSNFQSNMKEIYRQSTNNAEIDKFNIYFLKEVKKQGNEINTISNNEVLFSSGNKYTFNIEEQCIYLNDNIKIAENIENCVFSYNSEKLEDEKTVISVTIKAINSEEKVIEYVLNNEEIGSTSNVESDYTNYIPEYWELSKLNIETPICVEIIDNEILIAPIPKEYEISDVEGEKTISEGLVIKDQNGNEFVWIPVKTEWEASYSRTLNLEVVDGQGNVELQDIDCIEPTKLKSTDWSSYSKLYQYDSQEELDYYYGTQYYNFETDFDYETHYAEMVSSVNKYNGFYIGRYETTIDESGNVGTQYDTEVLTPGHILTDELIEFIERESRKFNFITTIL